MPIRKACAVGLTDNDLSVGSGGISGGCGIGSGGVIIGVCADRSDKDHAQQCDHKSCKREHCGVSFSW